MAKKPTRPPVSADVNSLSDELAFAGDHQLLIQATNDWRSLLAELDLPPQLEPYRHYIEFGRGAKKNFAQRLSNAIAQKVADALRPRLKSVLPDENGKGQESRSAAAAGLKKLDVNYSSTASGLELAISIKTINFWDQKTRRYTKNVKRVDGELRAEAADCHQRQPYAVLIGLIFLPIDAAFDGSLGKSSFSHAHDVYRRRSGRRLTTNDISRFERIWLAAYHAIGDQRGEVLFFDVDTAFPDSGLPGNPTTFGEVLKEIENFHKIRNA
jgi:hypothetical protein